MAFVPFLERFREIGLAETRSVTVAPGAFPGLPPGEYGFIEAFCDETNCDCRRVLWNVASRNSGDIVAVIGYGWESRSFYERWSGRSDLYLVDEMMGPSLNRLSPQSSFAPALLEIVSSVLLTDPVYIERIKRHYDLFRQEMNRTIPAKSVVKTTARNATSTARPPTKHSRKKSERHRCE